MAQTITIAGSNAGPQSSNYFYEFLQSRPLHPRHLPESFSKPAPLISGVFRSAVCPAGREGLAWTALLPGNGREKVKLLNLTAGEVQPEGGAD
ncbi:MAG TPA: hypothetical protein H9695_00935 [Candidatus Mediterraneibacter excrementigallinarum]|nr:hypothetical protein [Candidatus Mediterraneibacter excrementigallinarum]